MHSEKRRQRRVRHEAGPAESKCDKTFESPVNGLASATAAKNVISNSDTDQQPTHVKEKKKLNEGKIRIGGNNQRNNSSQKSKEPPNKSSSVAYIEEKQYESVSFMNSSSPQEEIVKDRVSTKYQRRPVISNWLQYDDVPADNEIEDGDDYLVGEDYSEVLKLQGSNSNADGYLHLKSELSWGETNAKHMENHGFGALKIQDLCAALATIPYHELLKIPEKMVPFNDIHTWNNIALDNKKTYEPGKQYTTNVDVNERLLTSLRFSEPETNSPEGLCVDDTTEKYSDSSPKEITDLYLDHHDAEEKYHNSRDRDLGHSEPTKSSFNSPAEISDETLIVRPIKNASIDGSSKPDPKSFNFGLLTTNNAKESSDLDIIRELPKPDIISELPKPNIISELPKPCIVSGLPNPNNVSEVPEPCEVPEVPVPKVSPTKQSIGAEDFTAIESPISLNEPPPVPLNVVVPISKTETEDLEDWLDSVLDD